MSIIVFCMVVFSLYGCKGNSIKKVSSIQFNNKKIIKVGVFEPLTGDDSIVGMQETYGIRYANEKYKTIEIDNDEYKIELVEIDHKSNEEEVEEIAKKLLSEKVSFVLGGYNENVSMKALEVFEKANVPFIACTCTNPNFTNGNDLCYRLTPDDTFLAATIANYIKNEGVNSVGIIYENDDEYSSSVVRFFERACQGLGLAVSDKIGFSSEAGDYENEISKLADTKPEYLFIPCSAKYSSNIVKCLRNIDVNCDIFGNDIWEYDDIISKTGSACEGLSCVTYFDNNNKITETAEEFLYGEDSKKGFSNFLNANGQNGMIYSAAVLGYDAYLAMYYAIQEANSLKMENVINSLNTITYEGVSGILSFDENGDVKQKKAYIKTIKNGIPVYKETVDLSDV